MHISILNLVLCAAFAAAWAAVGWYCWHGERQRARHQAEWARMAAGLRDLDRELDQFWAARSRQTWWDS